VSPRLKASATHPWEPRSVESSQRDPWSVTPPEIAIAVLAREQDGVLELRRLVLDRLIRGPAAVMRRICSLVLD
jgi:hypothetical protein